MPQAENSATHYFLGTLSRRILHLSFKNSAKADIPLDGIPSFRRQAGVNKHTEGHNESSAIGGEVLCRYCRAEASCSSSDQLLTGDSTCFFSADPRKTCSSVVLQYSARKAGDRGYPSRKTQASGERMFGCRRSLAACRSCLNAADRQSNCIPHGDKLAATTSIRF